MTTFGSIRANLRRRVDHLPLSHQGAVLTEFTRHATIDATVEHPSLRAWEMCELQPSLRFSSQWVRISEQLVGVTESSFLRVWGAVRMELRRTTYAAAKGSGR